MKKLGKEIIECMDFKIGSNCSFELNNELQVYVEVDEDSEGIFYHIELIDIKSLDILESGCSDIDEDSVNNTIIKMVQNI